MIASEVPEAKFQQHLNIATKESLSLPLTCATQKQCRKDAEELSENKIHAPVYFYCMITLHCFLDTALVEMSYSTPGMQCT